MATSCTAAVASQWSAIVTPTSLQARQAPGCPPALSASFLGRSVPLQCPLHCAGVSQDLASPKSRPLQVRAAKRSRFNQGGRGPGSQQPGPPPIDFGSDDNPKFILFVRATGGAIPEWFPLSIIDGGTQAKGMVGQMKSDFGRKIFQNTLTRNIAGAIYKGDQKDVIRAAVRQYPILKDAKGYEFAYKIADKDKPRESMMGVGVTKIPPKEELTNLLERIKGIWSNTVGSTPGSSTSS